MSVDRRKFLVGATALGSGAIGAATASSAAAQSRPQPDARGAANPTFADPLFNVPYIDRDEWRDVPVRHRYVHGGFTGTDAKFSFYFPPPEQYQGRFFQYITPVPASENAAQSVTGESSYIGFSIASGGYFVETNEGGFNATGSPGSAVDATVAAFRVNAAAAQYSRTLAQEMYGRHRTYGYGWGGSGGSYRTIGGFESTDAWDGVVPFIMGSPHSIPSMFTCRLHALRVCKDKFPQIVDATDPGGNGDIYAGLNREEREALHEATAMGFPPETWFLHESLGLGPFAILFDLVQKNDPGYFEDFWTVPGYLGHNPPASLRAARLQHRSAVTRIIMSNEAAAAGLRPQGGGGGRSIDAATAWQNFQNQYGGRPIPVAFQLANVPPAGKSVEGASILIGDAGAKVSLGRLVNDVVTIQFSPVSGSLADVTGAVRVGDEVQIDNSNFLAVQTIHRHQVPPEREFYVWDQFRNPDGTPKYPQRPRLLGPMFAYAAGGSIQSGRFAGKMIVVETLMDEDALPWQADWYMKKVRDHLGPRFDDNYRLWMVEHALHGNPPYAGQSDFTRVINYGGHLQQALRDLSAWVERGIVPPQMSTYRVEDGRVTVPRTAAERKGIQPVVHLTANGGESAQVRVGQAVQFAGIMETPGTGEIVAAEWDFDGSGAFAQRSDVTPADRVEVATTYTFSAPGTYFAVLRATAQREGDASTPYARLRNIGRVRIEVT